MIQTRYPGVLLNEVATGARPIEGVSTRTPNPAGPTALERFAHTPTLVDEARTAGRVAPSDSDFKYVNARRYLIFLEESIDKALQFAVFEPNCEALWADVRSVVSDFLFEQWQNGALMGARPEEAYFVKCDRSTMTRDDLDNGRLVLLAGVATAKPGEFEIFRISVATGTASR
jgi:phage tail sheath protein FI